MNFEKQVLKQSQEQPAYITSEHMLRMQRASMIRYEKSTYSLSLLPLFFAFSDELIKETDEFMKKLAVIQKCFVQARTDLELSTAISGMCRTVRSLPILLKNQPIVSTANHPTLLPAHTSFDLVYHYFSDSSIDVADFSQKLSSLYSQDFKVIKHFGGAFIIDPTIKKELTIQNSCNYTPYDPNIEIPPVSEVATPDCSTIEDLSKFTGKSKTDLVKAVMYKVDGRLVFVNIRGDLDVSEEKLRHFLGISGTNIEIQLAPPELLEKHGLVPGFSGLIGLKRASECTIIVDNSVQTVAAGVTGANKKDFHYINFNVARDTKKISKFIRYADVATNPSVVEGAVVAEIEDLHDCYPEMLGLDSKRTRTPLYKITVMLVDLSASLLGTRRKINGFYVVFVQKEEEKLERTIEELKKYVNPICIIVDNRAKSNFGQKMQTAVISMLKHTIVISSKLDKDTVSVDDQPVAINELKTLTEN